MNKDLWDSVRFSFGIRKRVPDPLTPAKNASNYQERQANGAGSFGAVLVDGHTLALTHRSIPLSPMGGYVSVTEITGYL
jgi:hypothetical protein